MQKRKDLFSNPSFVGKRIAQLRTERGLTQEQFAQELSALSSRNKTYSLQLVSAWESGRRVPTAETLGIISHFFCVTEEYVRGLSSNPDSKETENVRSDLEIEINDLKLLDGRPVYVEFNNLEHKDQFAIVNADQRTLIMKTGFVRYPNPKIKAIYSNEPDYVFYKSRQGRSPMTLHQLLKTETTLVWVESMSSDPAIRSQYNGWYRRNEQNTALINAIGLTLPLEGLNISYHAYLSSENK